MSELDDLEQLIGPEITRQRRRPRHRGEFESRCRRGHELTPENTNVRRMKSGSIQRNCKKCARLRIVLKRGAP